ncbi:ATP-binding protein [Bdellovibrio bacteriovorus]|uniref:ATP-binding protein n=1 Tax=Bdellovibrio bacteriovorus TaxID=959 RepID=UPI0035A87C6B
MLSTKIFQKLHFILALVVLAVATTVMFGWILRDPTIIQINPRMAPMVFNTAFSFAALAIALLFSEFRSLKVTKATSVVVVVISILTLSQYFFSISIGIDHFFIEPFYGVGVVIPGRMSVSASACFLVLSLLLFFKRPGYTYQMATVTVSTLVTGFSIFGIAGYALSFNSEYGWGSFSRMALHTSISFVLLSLAILWQLRNRVREQSSRGGVLIPFYVVMVGIMTSMVIWQLLVLRDQDRNKRVIQIRGESLKANLDNVFLPLQKSLEHMSRRFSSGSYPNYKMWAVDAESYFEEFEGLRRLVWADRGDIIRWVYPLTNGGNTVVNTTASNLQLRERLSKAPSNPSAFISRLFELKTGGMGFVLVVPVFLNEKYQGTVSAALMAEPFFSRVVKVEGYNLSLLEDGREIYSTGTPDPVFARDWKMMTRYSTLGANWDLILVPTAATIRENTSALPGVVLLFGVSVSVLLGLSLSFYSRSRESEKAAKEAFELKKAGMNSVPLMMISMDENTIIREMNATAERILEYTTEEVAGKTSPEIFHDANEVRDAQSKIEKELGRSITMGSEYVRAFFDLGYNKASEWTMISKSGKRYNVVISTSEIRDENGNVTGYLEVVEDVTALKEKERLLEEQEQKILASSRLASLGEMAAGIAHEINNPLAIIGGNLGILRKMMAQKGLGEDSDLTKKVDSLENVVHRIAKIIRGLRTYARESDLSGEEPTKVEALIDDTMAFCSEKFHSEGVEVVISLEPQLIVNVRPYQISQVLLNMLNNALDAVLASRIKKVTIEAQKRNGGIEISVSDTGPGVPYHLRTKIMEPFFTTKEVGKGVGLGLSISQGIIQSHNGKFYLDENSAKTRFVIWLPEASKDSKPIHP